MQIAIVVIVLLACIAYMALRVRDAFRHAGDPCRGCKGCALRDSKARKMSIKERKMCREAKKQGKNLVE